MTPPADANDLRGYYFKQLLMRSAWAMGLIAVLALAGGIAGAAIVGPAIAAAGFAGGLLIGLLIVFGIADSRAETAFFDSYAAQRQMTASGKRPLPPATPLLRKGDDRYAERVLEGPLGDGVEGLLALFTYEEESTDGEGNRTTSYYRYTIGLADAPSSEGLVPELYCQRKSGLRALEKLEDAFRVKRRVKLESEALDERYEIFTTKDQDEVKLRQVLSPGFIVWLTDSAPEKFAFELVDGMLCCSVKGHKKSAAELDEIRAASATVAKRLRDEALESVG